VPHLLAGLLRASYPGLSYYTFYLNTLRDLVTLTIDLFTLESCHVMPLGWSIPVRSLNWIRLTVPELRRLKFSIDRQLKVPIFTFFGGKMGLISNFIFLTPKNATCGRDKETKKRTETFMRQTGYLPRPLPLT